MSRVALAYEKGPHSAEVCYALKAMMELSGLDYHLFPLSDISAIPPEDLLVSYGSSVPAIRAKKHIHIYRSPLLYEAYKEAGSLPATPLPEYDGLPVIYTGGESGEPFFVRNRSMLSTNIDIPAATFFMITRYEEYIPGERDEYGCFPVSSSLAFREGFLSYPIVNRYLDLFRSWVGELDVNLGDRPVWRGRKFAVCLTHDVDRIRKYTPRRVIREMAGDMLRRRFAASARLALDALAVARGARRDPYWTFDFIMNLEERLGMRSSFFIRTDYDTGPEEVYSILDAGPSQLVKYITSRGHEIGLHGGVHGHDDPRRMAEERRRLSRLIGRAVAGARQQRLLWKNPVTWSAMADAGLLYDSTLSFRGSNGFRCGVCLPYRVFDLRSGRELPLWEIPVTATDAALTAGRNGGRDGEALSEVEALLSTVSDHGGVFVLLWHNTSLDTDSRRRVYAEVVEHIAGRDAYSGTCSGILRCRTGG